MALPLNIDDLIHQRKVEGARIEYKKGWNPEKVLHSVCAFANDIDNWGGGYIILGVEEKNGMPVLPPNGIRTPISRTSTSAAGFTATAVSESF